MINLLLSLNNFDENWCYSILKDIIKKDYNVLIVPLSYNDNWLKDENDWNKAFNSEYGTHYKEIVSPFLSYGICEKNIKWINQFIDSIDLMKEKIRNSDILFFTGGYPDKMMAKFQKYDLIHELENFNGIMIGTSAGAMVQISEFHITKDSDYKRYSYYIGLNIIKDFDVEVHFERPTEMGFDTARCSLPEYQWIKQEGFSEEEIDKFEEFLHYIAHLIFRFAQNGGICCA